MRWTGYYEGRRGEDQTGYRINIVNYFSLLTLPSPVYALISPESHKENTLSFDVQQPLYMRIRAAVRTPGQTEPDDRSF